MQDLRELAERFVSLSAELEDVRKAMLTCLTNGADPAPNPIQPARAPGGSHPNAAKAAEAEAQIIEVLRSTPGLGTAALARATNSKVNTTTERLRRMRAKGLIERDDASAGWQASAAAP